MLCSQSTKSPRIDGRISSLSGAGVSRISSTILPSTVVKIGRQSRRRRTSLKNEEYRGFEEITSKREPRSYQPCGEVHLSEVGMMREEDKKKELCALLVLEGHPTPLLSLHAHRTLCSTETERVLYNNLYFYQARKFYISPEPLGCPLQDYTDFCSLCSPDQAACYHSSTLLNHPLPLRRLHRHQLTPTSVT